MTTNTGVTQYATETNAISSTRISFTSAAYGVTSMLVVVVFNLIVDLWIFRSYQLMQHNILIFTFCRKYDSIKICV